MPSPRAIWSDWSATLLRLGLQGLAAWLIEAAGPLRMVGAQALYLGQPFLGRQIEPLAELLEDSDEALAFAAFLRKDMNS